MHNFVQLQGGVSSATMACRRPNMTIFCYPNCSTCKRATAYLERKGISYTYRNIKENRPSKEELEKIVIQSGKESRKFFNTSGQLYRSLELKDKIPELNDDQILDLLGSDGMLVKRPLLVSEKGVLVGFREAEWDAFFGANPTCTS